MSDTMMTHSNHLCCQAGTIPLLSKPFLIVNNNHYPSYILHVTEGIPAADLSKPAINNVDWVTAC